MWHQGAFCGAQRFHRLRLRIGIVPLQSAHLIGYEVFRIPQPALQFRHTFLGKFL